MDGTDETNRPFPQMAAGRGGTQGAEHAFGASPAPTQAWNDGRDAMDTKGHSARCHTEARFARAGRRLEDADGQDEMRNGPAAHAQEGARASRADIGREADTACGLLRVLLMK